MREQELQVAGASDPLGPADDTSSPPPRYHLSRPQLQHVQPGTQPPDLTGRCPADRILHGLHAE